MCNQQDPSSNVPPPWSSPAWCHGLGRFSWRRSNQPEKVPFITVRPTVIPIINVTQFLVWHSIVKKCQKFRNVSHFPWRLRHIDPFCESTWEKSRMVFIVNLKHHQSSPTVWPSAFKIGLSVRPPPATIPKKSTI